MAEAASDKVSFKSPYYDGLDADVTRRLELPPGLLAAIRTRGERSNADQVSSANAQTVYQIIPETRDAALKKWGVDAYLNEENAAFVAGKVLKESLERNKGAAPLAVAEYIGGTDPKQWGPTTRAYVQRVTGERLAGGPDPKQSTYERLVAKQEAANTPSIARVVDAYKAGRMTPEDKAAFEADVAAGRVMLPRGVEIATPKPAAPTADAKGTPMVPQGVIDAYQGGKMTPAEVHEFETDVAEGRVAVPSGVHVSKPAGIVSRVSDAAAEVVSGAARETEQTRKLPDWVGMPELSQMTAAGAKTGLGTLFAGPAEAVKVIQSNFPNTKVTQDEKGNYILTSSVDGQQYAIKPGFTWGDVPRAIGAIAAFTPAGRATSIAGGAAAAAGTEAVIQASQAATGGTFDAADVGLAAAGGAAVPAAGRVIEAAKPAVVQAVDAVKSRMPGAVEEAAQRAAFAERQGAAAPLTPEAPPVASATPAPAAAPNPRPTVAGAVPEAPPAAPSAPPGAAVPNAPEIAHTGEAYAPAKFSVSGLAVREDVPNMSSIKSSLDNYEILPGVREVPFSDFKQMGPMQPKYYSATEATRTKTLARDIERNGEISPLIVVMDKEGPYILEGGHRFDALREINARGGNIKSFPAVVVKDLDSLGELKAAAPKAPEVPPVTPKPPPAEPVTPPPVPPANAPGATVPPAAATPTMTAEELAATARKAAGGGLGSTKATQTLAAQTAPDAATVKAMDELGFHYQPDHVTTNQAYRELAQAVKSVPGSETRATELKMLEHNAQKADEIITSLGGSRDLSTISAGVKEKLTQIHKDLKTTAKELFDAVAAKIDPVTPTPATKTVEFIRENARQLGGEANLSAGEKDLLKKFGLEGKPPTYALLDSERKAANAAKYNQNSPFATMDSRLRDNLIAAMRADQEAVAVSKGLGEMWNAANKATGAYKAVQDDLVDLFGKTLEGSIVGNLNNAMVALPKGDVSRFIKMISAIPESMRKDVVASGLSSAFGVNARNGSINFNSYAKWFEGLERNKVARDALFSNLPPDAVKSLTNLYKASKGISLATRERITTGRIQAVSEEILKGDSLMGRIFDAAKKSGAAEAVTSTIGLPGAGVAAGIASALTKGKTSAMKAADALINSPEFVAAARNASKANIAKLARSGKFVAFVKAAGSPREMKDREKWVQQALQAKKDSK